MSHTDHAEDTNEKPNSALLLERLKEHEYRESNSPVGLAAGVWRTRIERGGHEGEA